MHASGRRRLAVETLENRVLPAAIDGLRISELMYHPRAGGGFVEDDFEYLELANTSAEPIELANVRFTSGISFDFADASIAVLAPGQRLLLVRNVDAFEFRYGPGGPIAGVYSGQLSNGGEFLRIVDGAQIVQEITYSDAWRPVTDGDGFSLSVIDPAAPASLWSDPANYRGSLRGGGSPGTAEAPLSPGDIVVNEVLAHTDETVGDWIELVNTTPFDLNIADWYLSDNAAELNRYRIGGGKFIPAHGYETFTQSNDFGGGSDPGALIPFGLSELGETVFLSSWDSDGQAAEYTESQSFRPSDHEISLGRHRLSTGEYVFVEQSASTFGEANAAPLVGNVVISEVMYNQPGAGSDGEFIELFNRGGAAVQLYDPAHPENTWRFTNGVEFAFAAGSELPAGGYALVVGIAPEAFRAAYHVPPQVAIFGPWAGGLDKNGEAVEISRPGDPELDGTTPYYRVDHLRYTDDLPWPTAPDGDGPSLTRVDVAVFGNDPASWRSSTHVGGSPGRADGAAVVPGDTNADGRVDLADLNNVRNHFGEVGLGVVGDTDGSGEVDLADLNAVRNNFGAENAPALASHFRGTASVATSINRAAAVDEVFFAWHATVVERLPARARFRARAFR